MLTKEKALYQVKLILDYLPKEEYQLISKETIDYIEDNFEYDENLTIDPKVPLEKQKIDDKAYNFLEKIIRETEKNKKAKYKPQVAKLVEKSKMENEQFETSLENIRLKDLIESLKKENEKLPKAKELIEEYKNALVLKEEENENLKKVIEQLQSTINAIPKFIRKIFVKETGVKLLK